MEIYANIIHRRKILGELKTGYLLFYEIDGKSQDNSFCFYPGGAFPNARKLADGLFEQLKKDTKLKKGSNLTAEIIDRITLDGKIGETSDDIEIDDRGAVAYRALTKKELDEMSKEIYAKAKHYF